MSIIDLHIHTSASDGTDSPEELLQKIRDSDIKTFAVTDHDTITSAVKMSEKICGEDVKFIRGIEFSCRTRITDTKCHILGLNYDYDDANFIHALRRGEEIRHKKFWKRIEILHDEFNITFTDEEIESLMKIKSVGKPHIANLIVSKGLADNKQEAIDRYVNKCRTGNDRLDSEFVINAILSSGGIPVWAHPLGGEGEKELPEYRFRDTLSELISYGLHGLECFYSKYAYSVCEYLESIANQRGLYVSGGSDYHGRNKNIPLGKLNAENIIVPCERLTITRIIEGVK
ncbi:MAG: PHP domain-containing protein [Synergistaceae bacterium]|nr:PHP domain-containing protein [Synergistaceae bacterium]MBQ9627829.1 PHP domain-containing protein [Synergistaceae bacterium]MBR0251192.1 PHP domain-containing protein [Synergistaceae bacterium]